MAVTVNGAVGAKTYQNAVTTKDITFTVSAGANLALVLTLNFGNSAVSGITAVWDQGGTNQSMTQIVISQSPPASSVIFGLRAPTVGNNLTLRISWTTVSEVFIAAICFAGVNQTSDAAAFPHTATSAGAGAATVTITSATGNICVAAEASGVGQGTATGTLIYSDSVSGTFINAMANYDNGAASLAIGNTGANTTIVAVDVAAAAGATASLFRRSALAGLGSGGSFFQNPLN